MSKFGAIRKKSDSPLSIPAKITPILTINGRFWFRFVLTDTSSNLEITVGSTYLAVLYDLVYGYRNWFIRDASVLSGDRSNAGFRYSVLYGIYLPCPELVPLAAEGAWLECRRIAVG